MKIVSIGGGLGNQMFKYAFALVLKTKHPYEKVYIDTRLCRYRGTHNGYELNRLFNLEIREASLWKVRQLSKRAACSIIYKYSAKTYEKKTRYYYDHKDPRYVEDYTKSGIYDPKLLETTDSKYYDVAAQAWQYYEGYKDLIKEALTFKISLDDLNKKMLFEIQNSESVGIHFRGGDYFIEENMSIFNVCSIDYYKTAIALAKNRFKNPCFYIFSNDCDYFKHQILNKLDLNESMIILVTKNQDFDSFKDMILMSKCKCLIIANSSFSWWGAWLNDVSQHLIIAPKKWMNNQECFDVCPRFWERI